MSHERYATVGWTIAQPYISFHCTLCTVAPFGLHTQPLAMVPIVHSHPSLPLAIFLVFGCLIILVLCFWRMDHVRGKTGKYIFHSGHSVANTSSALIFVTPYNGPPTTHPPPPRTVLERREAYYLKYSIVDIAISEPKASETCQVRMGTYIFGNGMFCFPPPTPLGQWWLVLKRK